MTKKICDRCGAICGKRYSKVEIMHFNGAYEKTAERDLCESCTNSLGEFIDGSEDYGGTENVRKDDN